MLTRKESDVSPALPCDGAVRSGRVVGMRASGACGLQLGKAYLFAI